MQIGATGKTNALVDLEVQRNVVNLRKLVIDLRRKGGLGRAMPAEPTYNEGLAERLLLRAGSLSEDFAREAARADPSALAGSNGRGLVERSASIALLTEAAVALVSALGPGEPG